jgi:RNA polymerase sigma factor, sigma-70 family
VVSLEEVIKECKQFNKLAQQMLYERYSPVMKGICLRYINDPEVVKDIMQDAFIRVFSNIRQYTGKGSFEGWMKRIFINAAISHLRKQPHSRHLRLEDVDDSEISGNDSDNAQSFKNEADLNQSGFEVVSKADFTEQELMDVMYKIPEKFRIVFNLYCIESMKHEEIAELLEIDVATSRTRLSRARLMIQKVLVEQSILRLS